jgi:hypothetical protein
MCTSPLAADKNSCPDASGAATFKFRRGINFIGDA